MSSKARKFFFGITLLFITYFWFRGALSLDPDFGWHLQMGKFILAHGIPATDPFSYTMSSYPFVDHEWLTNILFAKAMDTVGYGLFAGFFAFLALIAFVLQLFTLPEKNRQFAVSFFFLVLLAASMFVGVRPQILTWFFFSVILFVIRDAVRFERYRWFLPLLFLLWVNLHGGFAVGVVALALASGYWWYKKPAEWVKILSVFVLSVAATFVTPYGYRSWWEIWMQMTDGNLRWSIMEWTPTVLVPSLTIWSFIVFSVVFVGRSFRRFSLLDLLLYGGLLVAGLSSIRHIPLWLLIALPLTIASVSYFYQEIANIKFGIARFWKMAKLFVIYLVILVLLDSQGIWYVLRFFDKQSSYPEKAVVYLQTNQQAGQLFSTYNWGGYLIWKNASKKVYIDGRMPSWRWDASIKGESNYAFDEYNKFLDGTLSFDQQIQKYGIDTLLLPVTPPKKHNPIENMLRGFVIHVLHVPLKDELGVKKLQEGAQKAGWNVVYQDETAVIYEAPHK